MKRCIFLALLLAPFFNAQAQEPEFDILWTGTRYSSDEYLYPVFILRVWAQSGDTRQRLANTYAAGDLELLGDTENPNVLLVGEQVTIIIMPRDLAGWRDSLPMVFYQWEAAALRTDGPYANGLYLSMHAHMGMLERWEPCYRVEKGPRH